MNTSTINSENTVQEMNETKDINNELTAETKKVSNANSARRRIAEKNQRKSQEIESEISNDEEEIIAKSKIGKIAIAMNERLSAMEDRSDADEVAREVEKFVKQHEYKDYIDTNEITAKALDPRYSELELEEIIWLAMKDKIPEFFSRKYKEEKDKINSTKLPKGTGTNQVNSGISLSDYIKNRQKIIAQAKSNF